MRLCSCEQFPKMEGRQMVMVLSPHKNPKAKSKAKTDEVNEEERSRRESSK